ncbi:MAG: adenine phosphoribosyltransferase [Chloroflexi bacterium]|nr:adenine phosphoribosyltransferase [Chloroflexota bacterium]
MDLRQYIAEVPDFPEPGILYRDITPLLQNPAAFECAIDQFDRECRGKDIDVIAAIDARGFLFAAPLALRLGVPLVPARKGGKLPRPAVKVEYALEYGTSVVEMHRDAVVQGQRVMIIDDLLATGGTAAAAVELVEKLGGVVVGLCFLIELEELGGRAKIDGYPITSLIKF